MSDDVRMDPFIAKLAVRFALDQAKSQAQSPIPNYTIDEAKPGPAGDLGLGARHSDKTKYLG